MNAYRTIRTRLLPALLFAATTCLAANAQIQYGQPQQAPGQLNQDPPSRVARISVAQGNVSLEPAGVDTFAQAELNYPLTAGDRLYADNSSFAELQTDGLAVRMGNGADVTLSSLTDQIAQFGLAQGSIRLRTRDLLDPGGNPATVEVDTPNGAIVVLRPGDIRVDSYPQDDTTVITVSSGQVEISASNFSQVLNQGQSLRLSGNPVYAEALRLLPADALDNFDTTRERERQQAIVASEQYVDPGMIGVADLGQYGDWTPDPEYGGVWFPRAVPAGWQPYSNGHWAWVAPWGWTWIEAEPWGFAPFHYGRWAQFQGRWGWVAGPPPSVFRDPGFGGRPPRPVYSPALVAFVGGPQFSVSLGFGGGSGAGVTAWFPLGPHEAYQPWYHASPAYVNRVNVTNLYTRNAAEIRNTYVNRTAIAYNTHEAGYVNRQAATVAVAQHDFAAGRMVSQSQRPRLDENTQRQLAAAPVLPHPLVTPGPTSASPQMPARALPPSQARPVVETRNGFGRGGQPGERQPGNTQFGNGQPGERQPGNQRFGNGQPGNQQNGGSSDPRSAAPVRPANPVAPPPTPTVNPQAPIRQPSPQQVGTTPRLQPQPVDPRAGTPPANQPIPAQPFQPINRANFPQQREHAPAAPVASPPASAPQQNQPRSPAAPAAAPQSAPAPRTPDQPRPLVNRAEPQPVQPPFAQQRQAIERNDPGRPLGPQQVENLRQGRPAGPPAQAEPVHPQPSQPAPPPAKPDGARQPPAPR